MPADYSSYQNYVGGSFNSPASVGGTQYAKPSSSSPVFGIFSDVPEDSNKVGRLSKQGVIDLTTFDVEGIFKNLLGQATAPGAALSSVQEGRKFGALSSGTQKALESHTGDLFRSLSSAGLSPGRARESMRTVSFDAMRDLLGKRAELAYDREEELYSALQALANAMAGTDVAEKDRTLSTFLHMLGLDTELKAARSASNATKTAGFLGGLGAVVGAL